ncbi:hypothetical protein J3F83DRAFT_770731 [Trichoderma novae-zelandiae]
MPPKPRARRIGKLPQRKRKVSGQSPHPAVDPSVASIASAAFNTAFNTASKAPDSTAGSGATADSPAAAASPPSSRPSVSGSASAPDSETHGAQVGRASSTCKLPSPSLTNEASPASTHDQGKPYGHPTTAPAGSAPPVHTAREDIDMDTINQATGHQDGDVALHRSEQGMHTPTPGMASAAAAAAAAAPPLHSAMFQAIEVIKSRILQLEKGTETATATASERARYGLLLGACHNLDPVFLILHQHYCSWMIDRRTAYARFPIPPTVIDVAFGELYKLLQDDERLTPPHRLWCSRYPGFSDGVVGLDRVYCQVRDFITMFAIKWPEALKAIRAKKVPLMAFQIRDWFSCTSPTIANILFTYIRRVVGVPNGPLGVEINHLFNMDSQQERAFEEQKVSPEEMAGIRSSVLMSYVGVVQSARMQQAGLAALPAAHPSPGAPGGQLPANGSNIDINAATNTDTNVNINTDTDTDVNTQTNGDSSSTLRINPGASQQPLQHLSLLFRKPLPETALKPLSLAFCLRFAHHLNLQRAKAGLGHLAYRTQPAMLRTLRGLQDHRGRPSWRIRTFFLR